MKLSEKNVLIGVGVLFVIVFGFLKLENKKMVEQMEDTLELEIISSSYDLKDGKLLLALERSNEAAGSLLITINDENNNLFSGEPQQEEKYVMVETYIPTLNYEDMLEIVIQEKTSTKQQKIKYKIPAHSIIST